MSYEILQNYWWCLIALLGGLLVFLMFVQGANAHLANRRLSEAQKQMIVSATGLKWELTFTTLVTFGGAFFASFPLFYSTSFGGAYWVWVLLLLTFVFQAVSYVFKFRIPLIVNGLLAPFLVGTAVGTFFTGSPFTVNKLAISDASTPVISTWMTPYHGLDALGEYHAVMLGCTLLFLAAILGALYILANTDDEDLQQHMRRSIRLFCIPFLIFFLSWTVILLTSEGYAVAEDGTVFMEPYKYLHNLLAMPAVLIMLLVGVVLVLAGIICGAYTDAQRKGAYFWSSALGTVLVVMCVFFLAGFNNTAYYPSCADLQSSLTIRNSSSSLFTLQVMSWVSLLIPFVVAYIAYAWRAMKKR
ncbi:MAG: cytochrome d ubiquinol oxidase subunit II [Paludibacteraceae bacterium]|nr:cytochrome d ubiquinol oxidase subunit II [Paludibacteraceae bacterium]